MRFPQPRAAVGPVSRRPDRDDLSIDYHRDLVRRQEGTCVLKLLKDQSYWLCELASCLSTDQVDTVHSPYQWTSRQVIEHCANAERIFGDRMLRICAGDSTNLPAWDENAYAESRFGLGNFGHLVSELGYLREANRLLLLRISPRVWDNQGFVDGNPISVRGIAWVTAAHLGHHLEIIEQRCTVQAKRHA